MKTAFLYLAVACLPVAPIVKAQESAPGRVVPSGTHFLAAIRNPISTEKAKAGDHFKAETLETLVATDGTVLQPGAEVRGHVDKVEAAHTVGRARLWLTFDDVKTPAGWMPIVAELDDVPGVHSVRVDTEREGEIVAQSDKRKDAETAAAAGAVVGAATGVATRNAKAAAVGAAAGAVTAYLVASGLGQEVILAKNTKLEIVLERDLLVARN